MVDIFCVNKLCSESEFASIWIIFLCTWVSDFLQ